MLRLNLFFKENLCCIPNEVMIGSDVEQFFSNCLFLDTEFGSVIDSDRFTGCTCGENPCICNHDNK